MGKGKQRFGFGFKKMLKSLGGRENGFIGTNSKIQELIDNAHYNGKATKFKIILDKESRTLKFIDNGKGLDKNTMDLVLTLYSKDIDEKNEQVGGKGLGVKHSIFGLSSDDSIITLKTYNSGCSRKVTIDKSKMLKENVNDEEAFEYFNMIEPHTCKDINKGTEIEITNVPYNIITSIESSINEIAKPNVKINIELSFNNELLYYPNIEPSINVDFNISLIFYEENYIFGNIYNGKMRIPVKNKKNTMEWKSIKEDDYTLIKETSVKMGYFNYLIENFPRDEFKNFKHIRNQKTGEITCKNFLENGKCANSNHYSMSCISKNYIQSELDIINNEKGTNFTTIDILDIQNPVININYQGRLLNPIPRQLITTGDMVFRTRYNSVTIEYNHTKEIDNFVKMIEANKSRFSLEGTYLSDIFFLLGKQFTKDYVGEYIKKVEEEKFKQFPPEPTMNKPEEEKESEAEESESEESGVESEAEVEEAEVEETETEESEAEEAEVEETENEETESETEEQVGEVQGEHGTYHRENDETNRGDATFIESQRKMVLRFLSDPNYERRDELITAIHSSEGIPESISKMESALKLKSPGDCNISSIFLKTIGIEDPNIRLIEYEKELRQQYYEICGRKPDGQMVLGGNVWRKLFTEFTAN